ncbi:MAG: hypothetical protein ACREQL_11950 [Candidatus Binatia bacterium]
MSASWEALYKSQAQGLWALVVLPALLLGWLAFRGWATGPGIEPYAARFVRVWAVVFAAVAIIDPIATGPLGWPLLPFVLLGDFRVFALVLVVMEPGRSRTGALAEAAAWTLVVPGVAYGLYRGVEAVRGPQPETLLWLVYEIAFATLALALAVRLVPGRVGVERMRVRRYVRAVLALVGLYYVLWAIADVVILRGDDWGWALRVLPNQLYYGVFVPTAYALFFASRSALSSTSTQAAR